MKPSDSDGPITRRTVLQSIAATGITASLAGCTLFGPETKEFTTEPRGIPAEEAIDLGYKTLDYMRLPVNRRVTDEGEEVVAEIENHAVVYKSEHLPSRPPLPVAVLTTPSAEVGGTERNPFLARAFVDLLVTDDASSSDSSEDGQAAGLILPAAASHAQSGAEASIASGDPDRNSALRQGFDLFQSSSDRFASDTTHPSNRARYQQQSDTPEAESDEGSREAGPPTGPLAKLIGPEGMGLTADEITGWEISPRLVNETPLKNDQDVTSKAITGVAKDASGNRRSITIEEIGGGSSVVFSGTSKPNGSSEIESDLEAIEPESEGRFSMSEPDKMSGKDDTLSDNFFTLSESIDPKKEAEKMPGKPDGPDIAISVTGPGAVTVGGTVEYTVEVANRGTEAVENVSISGDLELPSGKLIPGFLVETIGDCQFTNDSEPYGDSNGVTCSIPELKPGDQDRFDVEITAAGTEDGSPSTVTAMFEATTSPPDQDVVSSNDTDEVVTRILTEDCVTNPETGHKYCLTPSGLSYEEARSFARGAGGHLVSITSEEEQQFLADHFGSAGWVWIGLVRAEEGWRWTTGEPVTYTNWASGEPNNYEGCNPENEVVMNWDSAGDWNDLGRECHQWDDVSSALIEFE